MESQNEISGCRVISAGLTTRQTRAIEARDGDGAPEQRRQPCNGCFLRNCRCPSKHVSAVRRVARRIRRVEFGPGAVLYRAGQYGAHLYVMHSGFAKLVQYSSRGCNDRIVRLLHKSDVAGIESLLGGAYHHTAIALNAAVACVIPRDIVMLLMAQDSGDYPLHTAVMICWQQHLDAADEWLCSLSAGPAQARVARLISYLISIQHTGPTGNVQLLGREDMASVLGLAYESVCREVSRLRSFGALRYCGEGRYAYDSAMLEEIAWSAPQPLFATKAMPSSKRGVPLLEESTTA